LLAAQVVRVRLHQLLALLLPMQGAAVAVDIHPLAQQREQAVRVVEAQERLLVLVQQVLSTLVVVVVVVREEAAQVALAALVLSFFQSQRLDTQAQPQVHQQSPQVAQIQF
tara:strand:+ start:342 stop:674 length:333 start_codon:yes stop_codon:yes gene_type:complete